MVWLTSMIIGFPLVFYVPAHFIFRTFFPTSAVSSAPVGSAPVSADD
jgi:hypothetical protein